MAKYIFSTLTCDNRYTHYEQGGADIPLAVRSVLIKGGANVANKRLITPEGAVVTEVSDDDLKLLRSIEAFKLHEANGFVRVSDTFINPEVAAADMDTRSPDAPLTPADYEAEGLTPPTAGDEPPPPRNNRRA